MRDHDQPADLIEHLAVARGENLAQYRLDAELRSRLKAAGLPDVHRRLCAYSRRDNISDLLEQGDKHKLAYLIAYLAEGRPISPPLAKPVNADDLDDLAPWTFFSLFLGGYPARARHIGIGFALAGVDGRP